MSADHRYPTDVTDELWELLHSELPERTWCPGGPGRPPCDVRRMVNGILYVNKIGGQWRLVLKEFGHWNTIYGYVKRWRRDGVWARVMETLRQWERRCLGRKPEPSAGSIDSQSIKTATQNEDIGFDGHKKITGRKRHILVDTPGLIIAVVIPMPARMIAWDWWSDEPSMLLMGSSGCARYGSMAPILPRGLKSGCEA